MSDGWRRRAGALLHDWPRWAWHLAASRSERLPGHWTRIRNRSDELEVGPGGRGARTVGRWTSRLHGCDVFPRLGRRLLARSLAEWPVARADAPRPAGARPDVTFVIGHRGAERLPLLLETVATVAGQDGPAVECVVVEQSAERVVADALPAWVRPVHAPPPAPGMPYSRSWAFNVGARAARGEALVFHDNDMLVPAAYAAEAVRVLEEGYRVANLKRFVFYLGEEETRRVLEGGALDEGRPERVVQNLEGGGSVAIDRASFFEIGGFDEAFVGWGGEDNEFWERARDTLPAWPYGRLPILHLWHAPQPEKGAEGRATAELLEARTRVPAAERVAELRAREFGSLAGPDPAWRSAGKAAP